MKFPFTLLLFFFVIGITINLLAQPGTLDNSFDSDGKVTTPFWSDTLSSGRCVKVQEDGKILVSGYASNGLSTDFAVVRYNTDGSLDSSFGLSGKVLTDLDGNNDYAFSMALQIDGKILVVGTTGDDVIPDIGLLRYNSDGTLDDSFGLNGIVITDINNTKDNGRGIALQPDGKIIVAGYSGEIIGQALDFMLVRYDTDGTLDSTFNGSGKVITAIGINNDAAYDVAVQTDGKILVPGESSNSIGNDFALIRYNQDGTLDTTFSNDGKVIAGIGKWESIRSISIQPDGKIIGAGFTCINNYPCDFAIIRYNMDGTLDSSFGIDGLVTTTIGARAWAHSIHLQPDGKIIAAGYTEDGAIKDFALVRYLSNGILDNTFGNNGIVTTDFAGSDVGNSGVLQPDGKIVVAGSSVNGTNSSFAVARYLSGLDTCTAFTVYADLDGDSYGDVSNISLAYCDLPTGYVANSLDCNDNNAAVNPAGLPSKQWDGRFGGTVDDRMNKIMQTSDKGYILCGHSKSGISGDKSQTNFDVTNSTWDYWVVKTNLNGVKKWDKRFGGTANDELTALQLTVDGGFIFGGYSYSGKTGNKSQPNYDASLASADYWIVKTNGSGVKQWDFRYGGTGDDLLQDIQITSDGGYILGGYSNSGISGDKSQASQGEYDYWIIKINASGIKQWDARFGGTNIDYLYDLHPTTDGGYILGGRSYSDISGDKTQNNWDATGTTFDYWILKIDANGIKQWDKRFGGKKDDFFYSARQSSDGGYVLAGYTNSGANGDITKPSQSGWDYWMIKIDGLGAKLWDARFGGSSDDQLFQIEQSFDNGYLLVGSSSSPISGDKTQSSQGSNDYWIVKTDGNGIKKWDVRFGGNKVDVATGIQPTSEGGYIVGGYSFSAATGDKSQGNWDASLATRDYWIVKLTNGTGQLVFYADSDADGYGDVNSTTLACSAPTGYVSNTSDCDDALTSVHPGAPDLCNSIDDNCNGVIDENAFTAIVTPTGSVTTCANVPVTLTANTGTGLSYQWKKDNNTIAGATNSAYTTSSAGSYKVTESNSFNCISTSAATIITLLSTPSATITPLGNLDICATGSVDLKANGGGGLTYQWKKAGNNIGGATNQIYTATTTGTYKVTVTGSNGCSKISNGKKVTKSCKDQGESKSSSSSFIIFPNPSDDHAFLQFSLHDEAAVFVKLYDVSGKEMTILLDDKLGSGEYSVQFNTNHFPKGVYLVRIIIDDGSFESTPFAENLKLVVQ